MEEFKKPSLPTAPPKVEKSETPSATPTESAHEVKTQLCPYKVPKWSDKPSSESNYNFEVLKSGQIINEVKQLQKKAYWTFGRLPENDIEMAHPTISRFHAILQYRPKGKSTKSESNEEEDNEESNDNNDNNTEGKSPPEGWYIFDMDSTHGTFLNKQRIPPKVYIRIRVGHMLRLGASTRSYILQGPSEDEEPESELSVTELKAKRQQELEEAALEKKRLAEEAIERAQNEGCSWGMGEDADEETDLTHNPYAVTNNEEMFLDDPKKTLRGYFEREGLELVYKCDEMSAGSFVCRVELPIDDANGRAIVAEVVHKGKKKDCVYQCALEACRLLDRHGVLRQANQEPLKRKQKSQNSDSDDDEFWDRTGDVARKKQRKANANTSVTLTYEDLLKQENDINVQMQEIETKVSEYQVQQERLKTQKSDEGEDLDAFMENLQEETDIKVDKMEIRKLRLEEQRLKSEKQRVQRLIKIAKPLDLPFNKQKTDATPAQGSNSLKKQLPMIGKRNQFSKFKIIKTQISINKPSKPVKFLDSDEEEMEEKEQPIQKKCGESTNSEEITLGKGFKSQINETTIETMDNVVNETIPKDQDKSNQTEKLLADQNDKFCERQENIIESLHSTDEVTSTDAGNSSNKKRRHRVRQRGKRQEVDVDEDAEYESSDKYAKWIPPENQTGDGFTELNKKFGY